MRDFGKGFVVIMFLSSSFLTGCASVGRGSGEYNLSQNEAAGGGSISQYQPVVHFEEKITRSKLASRGSS